MVIDKHRNFARAVVALARSHGMNRINMTFQLSHTRCLQNHDQPFQREVWEQVKMNWSEGRHGDQAQITLQTEARQDISEKEPAEQAA